VIENILKRENAEGERCLRPSRPSALRFGNESKNCRETISVFGDSIPSSSEMNRMVFKVRVLTAGNLTFQVTISRPKRSILVRVVEEFGEIDEVRSLISALE